MTHLWRAACRLRIGSMKRAVRRVAIAALVLVAATGLGPGPAMSCGPGVASVATGQPAPDVEHSTIHHAAGTYAHAMGAPEAPASDAPATEASSLGAAHTASSPARTDHTAATQTAKGHATYPGTAAPGAVPPCCHPGCPACLAFLPASPDARRAVPRRAPALIIHASALPAGIAIPPPLGPPRAA